MEKFILRDQAFALDEAEAFRHLHVDPEGDDGPTVREMLRTAAAAANPKAVYGVAPIQEKGEGYVIVEDVRIPSELVRTNLEGVNRIVPYVVTCGVELEEWSQSYTDILEQFWADGIKLLYMGELRKRMAERIRSAYFPKADMSMMQPGSLPAWPLPQQAALFALIGDVTRDTGVTLTDSFLMLPSKSVSGFFFSSQSHYENCQFCPILTCPGRRSPFRGEVPAQGN